MASRVKRFRQFSIHTVLAMTLTCAAFAAGYRSGYQQSDEYELNQLIQLIESTIVPDVWNPLGGQTNIAVWEECGVYAGGLESFDKPSDTRGPTEAETTGEGNE